MFTVLKLKNTDGTIKEMIEVYGTRNEPWFRGSQIAKLLGYKNERNAIMTHVNDEDRVAANLFPILVNSNLKPSTLLINKRGLESLVCRSKLPNSIDIAKQLGINIIQKITVKECDIMSELFKIFKESNIRYTPQYYFKEGDHIFKIDCYLDEYNIAIEIDENNHKNRNQTYEKMRQDIIQKKLGCIFIRENPDDENFCFFSFVGKIFEKILYRKTHSHTGMSLRSTSVSYNKVENDSKILEKRQIKQTKEIETKPFVLSTKKVIWSL